MKKEYLIEALLAYFFLSIPLWGIRVVNDADCKLRYMDYAFPITRLHCPVGGEKEDVK